jgi:hypothetical protein
MTPEPSESTVRQQEIFSRPADISVKPSQVSSASSESHCKHQVPKQKRDGIEKKILGVSERCRGQVLMCFDGNEIQ